MGKRLLIEDFISKAKAIHGDKYDYSLVKYNKSLEKVSIVCSLHGEFKQTPNSHLRGSGCPACGIQSQIAKQRLSLEEFIERSNEIHNWKYDYSKSRYSGYKTPIKIICKLHGGFFQTPNDHLSGSGCPKCGMFENSKTFSMGIENFIERARKIHNYTYDYTAVKYVNAHTKVDIICKKHGKFMQSPDSHLRGQGCPYCYGNNRKTTEDFIKKAKKNNLEYDYSLVVYKNTNTKVKIICPEHGVFMQTPKAHLQQGQGCPKCIFSSGERAILKLLERNSFAFSTQYRIKECKNKRPLPFDFAVFDDKEKTKLKCLIEYDGEQHYKICKNFKMTKKDLEETQRRDKIKTDYCLKNNIKLVRIPYWEKDNIETILENVLTNS